MIPKIEYPYNVQYVNLPGDCRVAYMDEGSGSQTLLFIHGLANYAPVWRRNIEFLKQHYRCIAMDLPGNGLSDQNNHPFGMQFFADVVFHFIEALGLKQVSLAGHSMGGQVALTAIAKYPQCAHSLILCAPAGFEEFTALDKTMYYGAIHLFDFMSSEEHNLRSTMENSLYRHKRQAEGIINDLVSLMKTYKLSYYRKMIEACIKAMLEEPVLHKLQNIQCPVLVLFGEKDALIPNKLIHHTTTVKVAEQGTSKLPHAKLHIIPECGHFLQWEKHDEVNSQIVAFLCEKK